MIDNLIGNISNKPYIIGLSGGSASGKTSVTREIFQRMGVDDCLMITMDSYYRVITAEERKNISNFNFDHPTSFDYDLLFQHLKDLLNGKSIEMPVYSFVTSSREEKTIPTKPSNLIIFEGIFALYDKRIRDIMDMMIFVDTEKKSDLSEYMSYLKAGVPMGIRVKFYKKF